MLRTPCITVYTQDETGSRPFNTLPNLSLFYFIKASSFPSNIYHCILKLFKFFYSFPINANMNMAYLPCWFELLALTLNVLVCWSVECLISVDIVAQSDSLRSHTGNITPSVQKVCNHLRQGMALRWCHPTLPWLEPMMSHGNSNVTDISIFTRYSSQGYFS